MQKQADPYAFSGNHFYKCINSDVVPKELDVPHELPKLLIKVFDPEVQDLVHINDCKWHDVSELPGFNDLDFREVSCTCKSRGHGKLDHDFEAIFNYGTNDQEAILYRGCKRTILAAAKRQIKSAPTPDKHVVDDFLAFSKAKIEDCMGEELTHFGYSFSQWFNHLTHDKQIRMAAIHEYLTGTVLPGFKPTHPNTYYHGIDSIPNDMLRYEGICKVEIQAQDGKPRMVCSIPDLIKYVMGPICWRLEEVAADKLPVYCGGMNLTQMEDKINHYIDKGFDLIAQGDGSAFDNTQDVSLKELDRYIYRRVAHGVYHVPRELFMYISQAIYKVMNIKLRDPQSGKIATLMRYAVLGTVFSGDCDTTLMNTIRMGMYNWYTNERMGLRLGEHFVCWSKGDDFSVLYNRRLVGIDAIRRGYCKYWLAKAKPTDPGCTDRYDARVYGLGQILKMLDFGGPDSFEFCSLNAWYTDLGKGHITLTRNVNKLFNLGNYSRKLKTMDNFSASMYICDMADALLASYAGIHIFEEAAQCLYWRAKQYWSHSNAVNKRVHKRKGHDPRVALPVEDLRVQHLYHVTFRRTVEKLVHNMSWWESISKFVNTKTRLLNGPALDLVNKQIDAKYPPGTLSRKLMLTEC
jgi:hypothetical protein